MKTALYAFVEVDTGRQSRYGTIKLVGYVTKSILKSNQRRNKRVRVMSNSGIIFPKRKQIITIIPFS